MANAQGNRNQAQTMPGQNQRSGSNGGQQQQQQQRNVSQQGTGSRTSQNSRQNRSQGQDE